MQQDYVALLMNARRLSDAGDADAAEHAARTAVAMMPERPTGIAILALILSQSGALDEAAALADDVLAIAPEDAGFRNFATSIALQRGRFAEARGRALAALSIAPGDQRARCDLILADHALGGGGESVRLLDYARHVQSLRVAPPEGFATMAAFDDAMADAIGALIDEDPGPGAGTLIGGMRLDDSFDLPRLLAGGLRDLIGRAANAYLGPRDPDLRRPRFHITSWANRMRAGDHELPHIHESGWISGVYYPRLPALDPAAEAGRLAFGDHHFGAPVPPLPTLTVMPEQGALILFPSYLYHRTIPFAGPGDRISVAFDIAGDPGITE